MRVRHSRSYYSWTCHTIHFNFDPKDHTQNMYEQNLTIPALHQNKKHRSVSALDRLKENKLSQEQALKSACAQLVKTSQNTKERIMSTYMNSSDEKPSLESSPSEDHDDVLEQMLAEAERLAFEMRHMSQKNLDGGSSASSFQGSYVPETIHVKDNHTECSSMEKDQSTRDSDSYGSPLLKDSVDEESDDLQPITEESPVTRASQVEDVLRASQEMARQLEAIKFDSPKPFRNSTNLKKSPVSDGLASPEDSQSPYPASPDSVCGDSKTTTKVSHVARNARPVCDSPGIADGADKGCDDVDDDITEQTQPNTPDSMSSEEDIKWDKVEYAKENDDDYVTMVDYVKETAKPKKDRSIEESDTNVKWDKVEYAAKADEDYAPVADYAPSPKKGESTEFEFMPDRVPKFDKQRAALRKKRRAQRRMNIVSIGVVTFVALTFGYFKWSAVPNQVSQDSQEHVGIIEAVDAGPSEEELAARRAAEVKAALQKAEADRVATEIAAMAAKEAARIAELRAKEEEEEARLAALEAEAAREKALKDERTAKMMNQLCSLPLAGLLSPACRNTETNADRKARLHHLVQAMMQ